MLKNTTFCVLLAAVLMLMGAAVGAFMKMDEKADDTRQASAPADEAERSMVMPVAGEVVEPFGAKYSAEYGQWSLAETVLVAVNETQTVCAPLNCTVESIEAMNGGGSRVTLSEGEIRIRLQPVYNLRVFAGSRLAAGDVFAAADSQLEIYMERGGVPVDPVKELAAGGDAE